MTRYYCTQCQRYHYRGKIYTTHLQYKNDGPKKKSHIPTKKIIDFDMEELRPIAQRQVKTLLKKMRFTNKQDLYKKEINKVIMYENQNN
jgi:hypothetical protein